MTFKIGQMVRYEPEDNGLFTLARVEAKTSLNRYRVLTIPDGNRVENVPGGDIAAMGEDAANARREASALNWYAGGATGADGRGGRRVAAVDSQAIEQGANNDGRN